MGGYGGFILAAYASTAVLLGLVTLWVLLDYRTQRRALAALEAQGIRRRSSRRLEDAS